MALEDAPQGMDEKLNQRGTEGKARRNLKSLRGYAVKPFEGTPDYIEIRGVERSAWRLVDGKGDEATYERTELRPLSDIALPGNGDAARIWNGLKGKRRK